MAWADDQNLKLSVQKNRNVVVSGRRTSMRLETSLWDALEEIARREGGSVNDLCDKIDACRDGLSLTGAVRAAMVSYFRDQLQLAETPHRAHC